jgi:putative transposase
MIESDNKLISISKQLKLLALNTSSFYYRGRKRSESIHDKELKDEICKMYEEQASGYRVMHGRLQLEGYTVGEKVVRRLMKTLKLVGPYPKRNLSKRNSEHKTYPYLLRNLPITHIDQVWATDITYINMEKGTAYLLAIIDLYSRKILSWRISNTMSTEFCIEALEEALEIYGPPEIFNTDQGSQFTSDKFTRILLDKDIKISMDGKGRALDNIFIERLWRTIKYDFIFPNDIRTMINLKKGISWFIDYYNRKRPHLSLNKRTPDAIYFQGYWELLSS